MIYNPAMYISEYAIKLAEALASGHAREHSYRPALKDLFSSFTDALAVNEPKRSEFGSPDFIILSEKNHDIVLGHAEAKDINVPLDKIEKSEQMRRYSGYPKIILTNGLEFRFFENGEKYETVVIGELQTSSIHFDETQYDRLSNEIAAFLERPPESIRSGKRLAQIMGDKARRIRDNIIIYLKDEDKTRSEELRKIYEMMKVLLVHDLTEEKFADMYAQTLVYGLFVARYSDKTLDSFTRQEARDLVPKSNPFLRKFFDHIAGSDFDVRLGHIVDELCAVFMVSDVQMLVHKHLRILENTGEKDPIIHFYEDFLKEYDPNERKKMGAYYTPIPVVQFIVKQVDKILQEDFGITKGLADAEKKTIGTYKHSTKQTLHRVQILDPAVGTATFLNEIIKYLRKDFEGQEGRWESYVKEDLLPRLYGFELMMAPYTIAHLKLGMTLQETGVKDLTQRLGVFLTNTLEEGLPNQINLDMAFGLSSAVAEEASQAGVIKHSKPIMVLMGNPPYSGHSSNVTNYAQSIINKYKQDIPELKRPAQAKWLSDDYVKFIAFSEDLINKNGEGIVAVITNNAYLDNPTFRGMRRRLLQTFDTIRILDLHGSFLKRETAPDGSKDENVFDIQQGVAIMLASKFSKKKSGLGKLQHAELFGLRSEKFNNLSTDIKWTDVNYDKEMYFFTNKDMTGIEEYRKNISITELFSLTGGRPAPGIVTTHDSFAISWSAEDMEHKINDLIKSKDYEDASRSYRLCKTSQWDYNKAKEYLATSSWRNNLMQINYRPFDNRWTVYDSSVAVHKRERIMSNYLQKNIGLMLCRQQKTDGFHHVLIHDRIVESSYVSNRTSEIGFTFPLYIYHDDGTRTQNFKPEVLKEFTKNLNSGRTPSEILDYIYAVLYSPKYREKYKEFLKIDFPRIPTPINNAEFVTLSDLGKQLRELHLMTSPILNTLDTTYPEVGSDIVEGIKYWIEDTKTFSNDEAEPKVHKANTVTINNAQYFGNVPEIAWSFRIGGYQPAQKWLKDRKGRKLTSDDIVHYQNIIKVLTETDRIMKEIDNEWTP